MKATIVVCDDDENIRQVVGESLIVLGYEVIEAADGQDALERVTQSLPDLIIMDILMPRMSGIEFVEQFRKQSPEALVPILLLTALSDVEYRVRGLSAGADDYLTKPFQLRELQARVSALLRTKSLNDRLHERNEELKRLNTVLQEMQDTLIAKERQVVALQLAGAATHKIRQPITGMLLNCFSLERICQELGQAGQQSIAEKIHGEVISIRQECERIDELLVHLNEADASKTETYVGEMQILQLEREKK